MDRGPRGPHRGTVVALVAHDARKKALLDLIRDHLPVFAGLHLVATGTTGLIVSKELGLPVERTSSGPEGGDLQIGALIANGEVDAVVFLRDPLTAHPHEPDIQALLKVCDVHDVPVATNRAAAEILVGHLARRTTPIKLVQPSMQDS